MEANAIRYVDSPCLRVRKDFNDASADMSRWLSRQIRDKAKGGVYLEDQSKMRKKR